MQFLVLCDLGLHLGFSKARSNGSLHLLSLVGARQCCDFFCVRVLDECHFRPDSSLRCFHLNYHTFLHGVAHIQQGIELSLVHFHQLCLFIPECCNRTLLLNMDSLLVVHQLDLLFIVRFRCGPEHRCVSFPQLQNLRLQESLLCPGALDHGLLLRCLNLGHSPHLVRMSVLQLHQLSSEPCLRCACTRSHRLLLFLVNVRCAPQHFGM